MLCRAVIEQLDRRTLTSLVTDPFVAPEDLLKTVLVDFGVISQADRSTGRLAKRVARGSVGGVAGFPALALAPLEAFAVVIIDEAQSLSADLLKHIGTVAETGGGEQLLQLMLVGRPAARCQSSASRGCGRSSNACRRARRSGRLREDEILGYVTHRLQVGGAERTASSSMPGRSNSCTHCRVGCPRVVNVLCDRALSIGALESARTIDGRLVRSAADDLALAPRSRTASGVRTAAMTAGFALLTLVGAAAGAFVFRSNVAALVEQWQALPAAPRAESSPTMLCRRLQTPRILRLDLRRLPLRARAVRIGLAIRLAWCRIAAGARMRVASAGRNPRSQLGFAPTNFLVEIRHQDRRHQHDHEKSSPAETHFHLHIYLAATPVPEIAGS